jgi:hypothetical protein
MHARLLKHLSFIRKDALDSAVEGEGMRKL